MAVISRWEAEDLIFESAAEITDFKHLSSYNWIDAASPTIVVPGSPALWAPPCRHTRLRPAPGRMFINQNAARWPDSPLEPLFLALYAEQPSFDIRSIDVVTDRNNLRKLLSFVKSSRLGDDLKPFNIEIEVHKNTALFCRVEECNEKRIQPGEFVGTSHGLQLWRMFPTKQIDGSNGYELWKAYTRNQIEGSTGHHRIVSYNFGGMSFIVRHEADGCSFDIEANQADEHPGTLASNSASTDLYSTSSRLTIRREGRTVPVDRTLAIKTRALCEEFSSDDAIPQLWISQTPNLVRAHLLRQPDIKNMTKEIQTWQKKNRGDLKRLAALIRKIISVAKSCGNRAKVRYVPDGDKLVISPLGGGKMLPEDLYLKWETKPNYSPS
ncbi:hypothetical protein EV127DRAFT_452443 [Xylaria flabelliformis]|nr:hypothetical protein EV127DRAFT_452443 [Xylaria flabelliformis]